RVQSRHRQRLLGARNPRSDHGRNRPRSPPYRQAAATRRSNLSGRRSLRGTRDVELPSHPFGSGHDHPHRLGVAQEGAPAEDGGAGSRPILTINARPPHKQERESSALRKQSLGGAYSRLICTLRNLTTPEPY